MFSSLAVLGEPATRKHRFASHITDQQRVFLCSETKTQALSQVSLEDLAKFEFFQPHKNFCRFLVVDIDNDFALFYLNDLPDEARPHAVVLTTKGAQAFWAIEGLPLTENAHRAPVRFAQDVGELLRRACAGDSSVDPLCPTKCRNPLFEDAEVLFIASCPPYPLKTLAKALRGFLRGSKAPVEVKPRRSDTDPFCGDFHVGARNTSIFNAIRQVAYRGGHYESLAYELNALCVPPLPDSEIAGIVRSVEKFMREKYTGRKSEGTAEAMPAQLRAFMAEIGHKGGSRRTEAQRAALAKGSRAGNVVKTAQAIGRKAQIQALKEAGYRQREVAEKMGISLRTVKGYWR